MIETIVIVAFVAWRVTDGGWHRLPFSNVIGWLLPPLTVALLTHNPYLAGAAVLLSWQLTCGYEDWDDYIKMAMRPYRAALFILACGGLAAPGLYSPDWAWLGFGMAVVFISNVAQPDLRVWADRLPGHGNRYVEGLEGAALGILCVTTSL
jgi:hypothetical protein